MSRQEDFYLFYLGEHGKQVKVSDGTREFFLPLSQVKFTRPPQAGMLDPVKFTVPTWLAQGKGMFDPRPGGLKSTVSVYVTVLSRGDRSWQVENGRTKPVWIDKALIGLPGQIGPDNTACITIPEWLARRKGLID